MSQPLHSFSLWLCTFCGLSLFDNRVLLWSVTSVGSEDYLLRRALLPRTTYSWRCGSGNLSWRWIDKVQVHRHVNQNRK